MIQDAWQKSSDMANLKRLPGESCVRQQFEKCDHGTPSECETRTGRDCLPVEQGTNRKQRGVYNDASEKPQRKAADKLSRSSWG